VIKGPEQNHLSQSRKERKECKEEQNHVLKIRKIIMLVKSITCQDHGPFSVGRW
jgi:hypothetical protein